MTKEIASGSVRRALVLSLFLIGSRNLATNVNTSNESSSFKFFLALNL